MFVRVLKAVTIELREVEDCQNLPNSAKWKEVEDSLNWSESTVLLFQSNIVFFFCFPEMTKVVRTELCLEPGEFDHYSIGVNTSVTFCLREFRALLLFAEAFNLPIAANFEIGGK